MHYPKGFPSRLVRLRADAGMTQKSLSKASGISIPQIQRYEMGTSSPRLSALVKLSKALNVDISLLSDAEDEPETTEFILHTPGDLPAPFTMPKDLFAKLSKDATASGSTLEEHVMALLDYGRRLESGENVTFEEVLQDMKKTLSEMPPLPYKPRKRRPKE
ncbi:HTH cro/C1-type domain-containing protein [Pseudomonas chlororaphis]